MSATRIDGTALAREVRQEVRDRIELLVARTGRRPRLATVLVGDHPASAVYVARKRKLAVEAGIADLHHHLDADATQGDVEAVLTELATDDAVSGVLLQLPLPTGLAAGPLIDLIPPAKDVDGLTTASAGLLARGEPGLRPCTPLGVLRLLDAAGVRIEGADAVVVGRSQLVGRPMAQLLRERHATVTVAHSRSRDLAAITRRADILVVAAGVPELVTARHVRRGAAVVDVGIHRVGERLVGDVRANEVAAVAGHLTPVPGGVGPMTIAMLLANTVEADLRSRTTSPGPGAPDDADLFVASGRGDA